MEIAVLVNSQGNTSGFEMDGMICVYHKVNCEWKIERQMEFHTENIMDSTGLHKKIREISSWLDSCKIIVVNRIRGIHYIAFEERQISMLEIKGSPEAFLEDIKECVQHQRTGQEIPMEHNTVFELRPGYFHIDLREVMKGNTSYSSKQILLPFIKNHKFSQLEMICDHVPKWMEKEQTELGIRISIEKYKDCMKVKLYQQKA